MNPTRSLLFRPCNNFRPQTASQLVKNLCFAFFAFFLLAFSLFSFFSSPFSLTTSNSLSNSTSNPTFNSSILLLTDDSTDQSINESADQSINESADQSDMSDQSTDESVPSNQSADQSQPLDQHCDPQSPINCADPEVYHLLMHATIEAFPDVHFYKFGKPVPSEENPGTKCDMAWRYHPKNAERPGTFKDYRRFDLTRLKNCGYSVSKIGDYHTGFNARKKKANKKSVDEKNKLSSFNDVFDEESVFKSGKYLVYVGGGDRCKDMNHYLWSLYCSLGEAQVLNRTLVFDLNICLSSVYSSWKRNEEGKDFRFYFDFERLKNSGSVIDQKQFWTNWELWKNRGNFSVHVIDDYHFTRMKISNLKETLVIRKFGIVEPDNYWYLVCEGDAKSQVKRPWNFLKKSQRLMDIASNIASKLNRDFDSLRILHGENANDTKSLWNFDSLIEMLRKEVVKGRDLYIVTDGLNPNFSDFDRLRKKYKIHFLDSFKDLWGEKTEWFIETKNLNNGLSVEFDGYMRKEVNLEVFKLGKNHIKWDPYAR